VSETLDRTSLRERARQKKRAQRERKADAARLRAIAEAEQIEATAETLAPAVLRAALWSNGQMIRGPLVEIVAGKAVHGAALPQFTSAQNRAAHSLCLDWRDVSAGCGVPAVDYGRSAGGGDGLGGHQAMLGQIKTFARLEAALTFLGAFTPGIRRVVLDRVPIPIWAVEIGKTPEDALAWVRAGLDRLGLFYFPPSETSTKRGFLTFGPSRASYDTTIPREGT
jgi:hypothetical protein